jgi:hypothetical protein
MKRVLEVLGWLVAFALLAFAGHAVFAAPHDADRLGRQQPTRAALRAADAQDEASAQDRRGAQDSGGAQDRDGARDSASRRERERRSRGREDLNAASLMREARTIYVAPTEYLDKSYLEYKLHKYRELDEWNLMLVADPHAADLVLTIDKTALNYIFNLTDARTSVIVASGKCVAVNGRIAAEFLGREIVNKIRDARAADRRPRKKRHRDEDADEDEGESSS